MQKVPKALGREKLVRFAHLIFHFSSNSNSFSPQTPLSSLFFSFFPIRLINLRQYILKRDNLVRRISDFHIITRILSTNDPISFLEVSFYFDTIFIRATWADTDDLVE